MPRLTEADMTVAASMLGPFAEIQSVGVGQDHQVDHLTAHALGAVIK